MTLGLANYGSTCAFFRARAVRVHKKFAKLVTGRARTKVGYYDTDTTKASLPIEQSGSVDERQHFVVGSHVFLVQSPCVNGLPQPQVLGFPLQ